MLRLAVPLRVGALSVLLLAFAGPGVADAAMPQVFTGSTSPVTCTVQVGANAGQRFCSGSPSRVPSWDGTPIDVSVTLPPEPATGTDGNFPLVSVYHGYGGSKITPASSTTQRWIARGYAVFSMSDRGFGQSCGGPAGSRPSGCATGYVRLIDNAYEVRDAQYLMSLLADDSAIDPQRIGATGGSYGGGLSYALGALKDRVVLPDGTRVPWTSPGGKAMRIAATAPEFGWTDLAYSLVPNGSTLDYVANSPYRGPQGDHRFGVQKNNWSSSLYTGGLAAGGFYAPEGSDPRADLTGWQNAGASGGPYDNNATAQQMVDELTANHSAYYIDDSQPPAPALLSNGWNDDLFPADEAVRYYNKVRTKWPTAPISMFHLDFGHSPRAASFAPDVAQLTTAENAWFDHYVKGTDPEPADARGGVDILTSNCATTTTTTRAAGVRYHAANWAKLAPGEVRLDSAAAQTITAPGTAPSNSFTSGSICTTTSSADNASAATYKLDPAPTAGFTIAGSPTVSADMVVTSANDGVYARLYDVDPVSSTQRLIGRQLLRPVGVGTDPARQLFQLHPQAWKVLEGHVVKLELLAQDSTYGRTAGGSAPQQSITVSNLKLQLPVLDQPGGAGAVVQAPATKVLPAGYLIARDFAQPPVIATTTSSLAYAEGAPATAIDSMLTVTDSDSAQLSGATVKITGNYAAGEDVLGFTNQNGIIGSVNGDTLTLTGSASVANYEIALRSVTYSNSSDTPSESTRTVTFQATDSGSVLSATATRDIAVSAVNDAPAVTTTGGDTAATEGGAAVVVDGGVGVSDVDSASLTGASVSITSGLQSGDALEFTDGSGISGSFSSGVLTLTGSASKADYQAALRSVKFSSTNDDPSASKTVEFKVTDGAAESNGATKQIVTTGADDAPTLTTSSTALGYTEGDPAAPVDPGVTVADSDDANLEGARVRLSSGFQGADELVFVNQSGITGSYNAGVLTLTGQAPKGDYQAALRSVRYRHTGDAPSADKAVEFRVSDGDADSNTPTRAITVKPVDDAPVAVGDSQTVAQDAGATEIDVLGNDTDVDGGDKQVAAVLGAAHGTVSQTGSAVTYRPDPGYCNTAEGDAAETFAYTLNGGSSATVRVAVTCSDFDADGSPDRTDDDDDNDRVPDSRDRFPFDAAESADSDGDGIGDNADSFDNRAQTRLAISHRFVPRAGVYVKLTIRCRGEADARCKGRVLLDAAKGKTGRAGSAPARGRYGIAKFDAAGGKNVAIRVRATPMLLRALKAHRHVAVLATAQYNGRNAAKLAIVRTITVAEP